MVRQNATNGPSATHRRLVGFVYFLLPLLLFGAYVSGQIKELSAQLVEAKFEADSRALLERVSSTVLTAEDSLGALVSRLTSVPEAQWPLIVDGVVDGANQSLANVRLVPREMSNPATGEVVNAADLSLSRNFRLADGREWTVFAELNFRQLNRLGGTGSLPWCLRQRHGQNVFCSATVSNRAASFESGNFASENIRTWRLPIDSQRSWSLAVMPRDGAAQGPAGFYNPSNLVMAFLVSALLLSFVYLVKLRHSHSASNRLLKAIDGLGEDSNTLDSIESAAPEFLEFAEAIQRAGNRVSSRLNLENSLSNFDSRVTNEASWNRVLESLVATVTSVLPNTKCSVVLRFGDLDATHYSLDLKSSESGQPLNQSLRLSEAEELLLYQQPVGAPVELRDVAPGIQHCQPDFGTTSCFVFPLKIDGSGYGFIVVANDTHDPLSQPLLDGLVKLADRAASAFAQCERESKLYRQAHFDSLTGLPNRVLLADRTNQALRLGKRHGHRVGLMFVDLDDFKRVNDSLGHSAGDKVLKGVADRLGTCIRESDAVARLAGDEFVVLISEIHDSEQANLVVGGIAKTIRNAVSRPFEINGKFVRVTPSIGVAISNSNCADYETLLQAADAAMYTAKSNGEGAIRFFRTDMSTTVVERMNLETELALALDKRQLSLEFQPLVSIRSGRVCAAEALLRWDHPTRGRIAPSRFIPLAEDSGVISIIGNWALREACRHAAELAAKGVQLPISVNLAAGQIKQTELAGVVERLLCEFNVDPGMLCVEVSEGTAMHDTQLSSNVLGALKKLGVKIALDDFGTSYSSLAYLSEMPVDRLKIDKRFIDDLALNPDARAIIDAIVGLGHGLGLEIVAEGVENAVQLDALREAKCDMSQGYHHAEPMNAAKLMDYVREHKAEGKENVLPFAPTARRGKLGESPGPKNQLS